MQQIFLFSQGTASKVASWAAEGARENYGSLERVKENSKMVEPVQGLVQTRALRGGLGKAKAGRPLQRQEHEATGTRSEEEVLESHGRC